MARATPHPDQLDLFADWAAPADPTSPRHALALRLAGILDATGEITPATLTEAANATFGGTKAQGSYSAKDAYDAMEVAFNLHLARTETAESSRLDPTAARAKALDLTARTQRLPTQTRRDPEMEEFQQFSTPPALAFVANWVARIGAGDVMMEPSAGTGDLAIWSHIAGARLVLNELSPRRHESLARLFPDAALYRENAEQLDNILPRTAETVPTVIVMNPPFSATAGRVRGQRDTSNGARHIEQALRRLQDNGRLVAIVGNGMAAGRPGFADWWREIEQQYTVRTNIGISGKEYAKFGTTFDNQIIVIDKTGPTTQPVLTGQVDSVAALPELLEAIRHARPTIHHGTEPTPLEPTGRGDTRPEPDSIRPGDRTRGPGVGEDSLGGPPPAIPWDPRRGSAARLSSC